MSQFRNYKSPYKFGHITSAAHKRNIPHGTMVGHLVQDSRDENRWVPLVSTQTFESSIINIRADLSGIYQNTSCVDMGMLFRPFNFYNPVGFDPNYYSFLPYWRYDNYLLGIASGIAQSGRIIYTPPVLVSQLMNPYIQGGDSEWISYGTTYSGIHMGKNEGGDMNTARGMALRGPLVMNGWGYNIDGTPTPNAQSGVNFSTNSGIFKDGFEKDSRSWVTGPVELLWDQSRNVWASNGNVIFGQLETACPAGYAGKASGAYLKLYTLDKNFNDFDTGYKLRVFNRYSTSIKSGAQVFCGWNAYTSKFWILTGDCGSL